MLTTPVDRIRCSLVGELRVPARASSLSVQPSPLSWRVGVHITTFEACSSFTRVTACRVAHPPSVGFIARLRPGRFPGSDARKLPSSTNNFLGWVLPPLVIYAVEAHTITPCIVPNPSKLQTSGLPGSVAERQTILRVSNNPPGAGDARSVSRPFYAHMDRRSRSRFTAVIVDSYPGGLSQSSASGMQYWRSNHGGPSCTTSGGYWLRMHDRRR